MTQKTKEEMRKILQKNGIEQLEKEDNFFKDILKAMDFYAEQKAIGFDKWKCDNEYVWDETSGYYWKDETPFLRDELYSLYLKSKQ